jgi:peptidoglycan hydrolase-like protein with peptidoglycan-binding domain
MNTTTYPSGYGKNERTLDALMDFHCPVAVTEPEFRRRLRHFLESKHGVIGIGDILPRGTSTISNASATGRSFHQLQRFNDGTQWASAVDLVVRRAGLGHSSGAVPWSEVPVVGSKYAAEWGVHVNVPGESWHMQAIEIRGHASWVSAGRPRPRAGFPLPCQPEATPDPVLVFDPRNAKWGLWPVNPTKPMLSTERWAKERQSRADNRWRWSGDAVLYLQGIILHKSGGNIAVDGFFGPRTEQRVKDVQTVWGLTADGLVGPKTWEVIDFLSHWVW